MNVTAYLEHCNSLERKKTTGLHVKPDNHDLSPSAFYSSSRGLWARRGLRIFPESFCLHPFEVALVSVVGLHSQQPLFQSANFKP